MPIPLLAVQGGSLTGRDRSGPVTLTGDSALRAVPSNGVTGWLVEEATTNYATNPRFAGSAALWAKTRAALMQDPAVTDDGVMAGRVTVIDTTGDAYVSIKSDVGTFAAGDPVTVSARYRAGRSGISGFIRVQAMDGSGTYIPASQASVTVASISTTGWTDVVVTIPSLPSGTSAVNALFVMSNGTTVMSDDLWVVKPQIEKKLVATTYTDGSVGPGYSWTGAANASASTRAGSALTGAVSGHLKADKGAVYLAVAAARAPWMATPSGRYNDFFSCQSAPSEFSCFQTGTYFSAVLGSSAGAITVPVANPASGAERRITLQWNMGAKSSLAVDGQLVQSPSVLTVLPKLHAANIYLGIGGTDDQMILTRALIYDRPLTDAERATLDATPTALLGWDTLIDRVSGVLMVGQPGPMGVLQVGAGPVMGVR